MSRSRKPDTTSSWFEITFVFTPSGLRQVPFVLRVLACDDRKNARSFAWWAGSEGAGRHEATVGMA